MDGNMSHNIVDKVLWQPINTALFLEHLVYSGGVGGR
jgi:hypothetical protein